MAPFDMVRRICKIAELLGNRAAPAARALAGGTILGIEVLSVGRLIGGVSEDGCHKSQDH